MPVGICKLCRQQRPLMRSHLIPSGAYALCRDETQTHVRITPRYVMHTSREVQDYLLCQQCENSLSKKGESWLLPKLARVDGWFPLLDILERQRPLATKEGNVAYEVSKNPDIDIEKLAHFGLGVFWKASVHSWSGSKKEPLIDLGLYAEELRLFLRGEQPYPQHVSLLVLVAPRGKEMIGIVSPFRGSAKGCHNFVFFVPGIEFNLFVGKGISEEARRCCFYRSPSHVILIHDVSRKIMEWGRKASSTARKSARIIREQVRKDIID